MALVLHGPCPTEVPQYLLNYRCSSSSSSITSQPLVWHFLHFPFCDANYSLYCHTITFSKVMLLELSQESRLLYLQSFLTCSLQKVKKEEKEGEDNEMLLHDMSITLIHFMWHRTVASDKCMFLVQL